MEIQAQHKRRMLRRHQPKFYHQLQVKHCMCTISIFVVKSHGKKVENKKLDISGYAVKLLVRVLTIKYFASR